MNRLEELKKKLQCVKCQISLGELTTFISFLACTHIMCQECSNRNPELLYTCPGYHEAGNNTQKAYHKDVYYLMDTYESSLAKSAEVERQLKGENSILKQQQTEYEATKKDLQNKILKLEKEQEDHHKCSECETTDYEKNMQLCATCHELNFENHENVKKNSLCAVCAIKKHIRKGHQIVDFFPYSSAYNFASHVPKIESQSKELKNARTSLKDTLSAFNALSINVSEKHNMLTDMARRSKSTRNQLEFVEKMETFINESKSIHVGADSELKERTKMLQESLTKLTNWCNARMDSCVDDSETIKLVKSEDSDNNDAA